MGLLARLAALLLTGWRRGPLSALDEAVLTFRVLPTDLDVNLHMNNARYLSFMDLGRLDLIRRMGILPAMLRRRWNPVLATVQIRFRRSLQPFRRFQLHTRLICWDEKWFYLEQWFTCRGDVMARAIVRGVFLSPSGTVPAREILALAAAPAESPPMPEEVRAWATNEAIRPAMSDERG